MKGNFRNFISGKGFHSLVPWRPCRRSNANKVLWFCSWGQSHQDTPPPTVLFNQSSQNSRGSGETSSPWHVCFLYFSWNHVCLAYWLKTQFYCSSHCHANKFPKEKAVFYCTPCNINKTDSQIPIPESLWLGIMQHRTYFGECLHKSFNWTLQSCLFMQMELKQLKPPPGRQPPLPNGSMLWFPREQFGFDLTGEVAWALDWWRAEGWGAKVGREWKQL